MRDVAVVAFAQSKHVPADIEHNEVEVLMPVVADAIEQAGIDRKEIGFICSGSCDYLIGAPFSFVSALDAVGAWPPVQESHVEMDGAWALYEAWVRLQHDDLDTALVYGFGKSSVGDVQEIFSLQLDPYYVAPLWPTTNELAALQARAYLEATGKTERDLDAVVERSRSKSARNPFAVSRNGNVGPAAAPLRTADCPPITDGAAVIVLATGDKARELRKRPAWITGIDHRIESHALGTRDLTKSTSTARAAQGAGLNGPSVDVAELHAQYSHEELILRDALGLQDHDNVNPSGGPLGANPIMATGMIRIGEAANRIIDGSAQRALAHATSGPCLQQNLVCVLEAK